jgi:integrase
LEIGAIEAPSPVGLPVGQRETVAAALAAAAAALQQAADALRGSNASPVSFTRSPVLSDSPGVREVVNEFLIAKARAGRSDRYLRQLRVSLSAFAHGRASRPIADVTCSEVERWLFSRQWKPKTMRGYLTDVRTLFGFALRRGYVRDVNACAVELPDVPDVAAPGIHTPEEVSTVLEAARRVDLDVMRHLALRYFTGVRSAEAHRMTEENLLLDRGVIEVPAHKAKTRRRRLVSIQPVLSSWLALGGQLRPMSDKAWRRVVRASGVSWPANVTRHSFVSYHLAAFESAGKTALEAGHSEAILFAHYRAVVTTEQAKRFWSLFPS